MGLPVNKKFFSLWSNEMSYILGMIIADGCLVNKRTRKDGTKQLLLDITSKDINLLKMIKGAMVAKQKIGLKSSGSGRGERYYHIQIGYQSVCKDLLKLGVMPRKTSKLNPIKVPSRYFSDFVRGFFDGDGTVYIYKVNNVPQIKAGFVSTSLSFLVKFNQQLCNNLDIPTKSIHRTIDKRAVGRMIQYSICFYVDDCEKLADFMYRNNPSLYLPRKRKVFERWKLINRRHYIKQNYPSKIGWRLNQKVLV